MVMSTASMATLFGTILASLWRILLMPVDTCKTVLQVEGEISLLQATNFVIPLAFLYITFSVGDF